MQRSNYKQDVIHDLKVYYGYPPHHELTNTLRDDPYYLISLLDKHKAGSLQELEKRVDFGLYHKKRQREIESWEKM